MHRRLCYPNRSNDPTSYPKTESSGPHPTSCCIAQTLRQTYMPFGKTGAIIEKYYKERSLGEIEQPAMGEARDPPAHLTVIFRLP